MFDRGAKGWAAALIAAAMCTAGGAMARGQSLGEATGYTEFIFGNSTRNGDTTGAVAIGGNADFKTNGRFTIPNSGHVAKAWSSATR